MGLFSINWWGVLIAVVFSMINGSLWYNPRTFFTAWWKVVGGGKEKPGMGNMAVVWPLTVIASAVKAIFVAIAVNAFAPVLGGVSPINGLLTGLIIGIGVIAPTNLVNKLFAGHGMKVWTIEVGNHLLDVVAFGLLFGIWP